MASSASSPTAEMSLCTASAMNASSQNPASPFLAGWSAPMALGASSNMNKDSSLICRKILTTKRNLLLMMSNFYLTHFKKLDYRSSMISINL